MTAAVFDGFGESKDKIRVVHDLPTPVYASNEVVIKVHAASLNPIDWKILHGHLALIRSLQPTPFIPGFDVAGEVVAVGQGCHRLKKGDLVYAMAHFTKCGTVAQYVSMKEDLVALKPTNLDFSQAASIPLVGLTTWQAIIDFGQLERGQKIFINGGSGGIGTFAIQLAKHIGAYVATTCSDRNIDLMKQLGADEIINYKQQDYGEVLKGKNFDVVYDAVGGYDVWQKAQAILKPSGRFATIVGDSPSALTVTKLVSTGLSIANRKIWSLLGHPAYAAVTCSSNAAQLQLITKLIEQEKIKPIVERVYDLPDVLAAFEHIISGRVTGKLVIKIDE